MKNFINDILREEEKVLKEISLFGGIFTQCPHECLEVEWEIYVVMEAVSTTLELELELKCLSGVF